MWSPRMAKRQRKTPLEVAQSYALSGNTALAIDVLRFVGYTRKAASREVASFTTPTQENLQ